MTELSNQKADKWLAKCFFMKKAEEEWKHDKVYCPIGHDDFRFCIDLLHDVKGHGGLYG